MIDRNTEYRNLLREYEEFVHPNKDRLLYTDGNLLTAKYFLIGESAGDFEFKSGLAFQGPSGWQLDKMLKESGIERRECYISNLAKEQPYSADGKEKNRFTLVDRDKLLQTYFPMLRKEISLFQGNIILALGEEPLKFLTGDDKKISIWRGSVLKSIPEGIKVIGTYHPSFILQNWKYRQISIADYKRAKRESVTKDIQDYEYKFIIRPNCEQVLEFFEKVEQNCTWGEDRINNVIALTLDVETLPNSRIAVQGFGYLPDEAISIPFVERDMGPYWTPTEEIEITKRMAKMLGNPEIPKVAQNAMFDFFLNEWEGMPIRGLFMDTMYAHHCLRSEMPHRLEFLTSIYTNMNYYKDEGKSWSKKGGLEQLWTYNCKDIVTTCQIYPRQRQELQAANLWDFFQKFYIDCFYPCLKTSLRGIKVNKEIYERERNRLLQEIVVWQAKIDHALGYHLNTNAPNQMKDFLYYDLGLPIQYSKPDKKSKQRKITSDAKAIDVLRIKFRAPILEAVARLKKRKTLVQNFFIGCVCEQDPCICGKKAKYDDDGRMRCTYNFAKAKTGRRSSSACPLRSGINLQNLPEASREMFEADEGKIFLCIDMVQAEAVDVAYESNDLNMINMYERGWVYNPNERFPAARQLADLHSKLAAIGLNKSDEDVTEKERKKYKKGMHASNYLQSSSSFAIDADLTFSEAERIYFTKNMLFPNLSQWQNRIASTAQQKRVLFNSFGRRRLFFDRASADMAREAVAQIPQSTVNDALKIAQKRLDAKGYEIILEIHDALMLQLFCNQIDQTVIDIWDAFNIPITSSYGKTFVIPVDMKIGFNWGIMEDFPTKIIPLEKKTVKLNKTIWSKSLLPIGRVSSFDDSKKEEPTTPFVIKYSDGSIKTYKLSEASYLQLNISKK